MSQDPAPVTEPATTEETCVLPKTFCELPATEEQPESSGFINGAASHDDNLEMVITTQTDIEMTSEPQNDSLVSEDSSKSPKTAEDKAAGETAVMATESSASVGSIQDQVVESSSDTNHNNSSDITMEVECEPQEALPKEEEPTSSATSNGTAKHDDTLELVITSQTDVEMACGSPKSPTDEAAIIELESSIAISSILGLVAKTSNDTNHKNEFGNEDIPMEETCEPQEVLPTHKTCELPATEEQPESSGFINSTASHDDTSEMVITSQTDIEITSEPQNDSLVTEAVAAPSCLDEAETEDKAVESSLQETAEVIHGCPSVEMESVAGTNPNNSEEPCASTSESIQESDAAMVEHENSEEPGTSSSETDKNDNAASKKKDTNTASTIYVCDNQDPFIYYDKHFVMANTHLNPNDVPDFFEQVPKTPTKETKEDNGPVQSAGMSRPSRAAKTKVINQVAASKEKGKETTEPQITERAPETKQRGKRGAEPHVAEEIPKTKRRGRTCNKSQIVEQSKGTKGKGKKTSEPQISEKGKNKPGTADVDLKYLLTWKKVKSV
ncbi:hypothetical protein B566_EDAN016340 [Ephemera danica]|nr:hypothetical protein B566_EDAN016340 [Ephemera danica]